MDSSLSFGVWLILLSMLSSRFVRVVAFFKNLISILYHSKLIHNTVLVSGEQQSDSFIHIHIITIFQILFP